ncbi:MAG: hypothetical protein IT563_19865 [Alphaproteobacteria bacterium]|nr:hypothetical protein [Alphaproteobacteria bacterium]
MRATFKTLAIAAVIALTGATFAAQPAFAGGGGNKNHHHHHHNNGYYYGFGGLATGLALGYAVSAYSQPTVEYVPQPVYYPYAAPAPAYPYYYAPAPVAPAAPYPYAYPAPAVTIVP